MNCKIANCRWKFRNARISPSHSLKYVVTDMWLTQSWILMEEVRLKDQLTVICPHIRCWELFKFPTTIMPILLFRSPISDGLLHDLETQCCFMRHNRILAQTSDESPTNCALKQWIRIPAENCGELCHSFSCTVGVKMIKCHAKSK